MPRQATLERVEGDIAAGRLDRARDRLLGLLSTYPCDLEVREQLGHVYFLLRDKATAGKYWYLKEARTSDEKEARKAFEERCGGHPARLLQALKVRGAPSSWPSDYSRDVVTRLLEQAGPTAVRRSPDEAAPQPSATRSAVLQYGCMLALALWTTLAIIGLLSILESFR